VVLVGVVALLVMIVAGRTDALLKGRRPYLLLGAILVLWIARLLID
jgi:hypothetical protein